MEGRYYAIKVGRFQRNFPLKLFWRMREQTPAAKA